MTLEVMVLDTFEVSSILESRRIGTFPVQIQHPLVNIRIASSNRGNVAFKVGDVDRVKAYHGHPCLCQFSAKHELSSIAEDLFHSVETLTSGTKDSFISGDANIQTLLIDSPQIEA
jgi:hypothetical protein